MPFEDPLSVSSLLGVGEGGVVVCGCANRSPLDQMEHLIDGPSAAAAAANLSGGHSNDPLGAVRPLGALLLYSWPEHPHAAIHTGGGGGGGGGSTTSLPSNLRSYIALTSSVTCMGYCSSRRLLLVGTKSGAVQIYSPSPNWAHLQYRFALEAHVSPVAAIVLRPHPERSTNSQLSAVRMPPLPFS